MLEGAAVKECGSGSEGGNSKDGGNGGSCVAASTAGRGKAGWGCGVVFETVSSVFLAATSCCEVGEGGVSCPEAASAAGRAGSCGRGAGSVLGGAGSG